MSNANSATEREISEDEMRSNLEHLLNARELLGPLSAARFEVVDKLVRIDESKLGPLMKEQCGICYNTFAAIIAEEEMLLANDTPVSERDLGVTKLETCGHYFCRKDITKWILEGNDACPYCRLPCLPESTRNAAASSLARAGIDDEDILEALTMYLQPRRDAASPGGSGANPRPARSSSSMYS